MSLLNLLGLGEYGYETFQYEDKNAWTVPLQKVDELLDHVLPRTSIDLPLQLQIALEHVQ